MIDKNMHKCHKHNAILHKLCMWFGLAKTNSASEMTYIVSSGALNSTHSFLAKTNLGYI